MKSSDNYKDSNQEKKQRANPKVKAVKKIESNKFTGSDSENW